LPILATNLQCNRPQSCSYGRVGIICKLNSNFDLFILLS
jgi:hypothetical protein